MARSLSSDLLAALNASETDDGLIPLVTITHSELPASEVPEYDISDALDAAADDDADYFDDTIPASRGTVAPYAGEQAEPPSKRAGWTSQAVLPGITSADHGDAIEDVVTTGRVASLDSGVVRNDDGRCTIAQAPDGTNGCVRYRYSSSTPPETIVEWHMKDFPSGRAWLAVEGEVWWDEDFDWGNPATSPTNGGKLGLGLYIGSRSNGTGLTPPEEQGGVSIRNIWSNGTPANPNQFAGRASLYTYSMNRRVARAGGGGMEGKKIGQKASIAWTRGRWVKLAYEVIVNQPGKADGLARMWIGGKLVAEEREAVYSLDDSWAIMGAVFSDAWNQGTIPQDQSAYLRNVRYWLPPVGADPYAVDPVSTSVRLAANPENVVSRGQTFVAFPFDLVTPDDVEETAPKARLVFDNVSQEIIGWIRSITTSPTVTMELVRIGDLDEVAVTFDEFDMEPPVYDLLTISCDLTLEDDSRDPVSEGAFTPANFPTLFAAARLA